MLEIDFNLRLNIDFGVREEVSDHVQVKVWPVLGAAVAIEFVDFFLDQLSVDFRNGGDQLSVSHQDMLDAILVVYLRYLKLIIESNKHSLVESLVEYLRGNEWSNRSEDL